MNESDKMNIDQLLEMNIPLIKPKRLGSKPISLKIASNGKTIFKNDKTFFMSNERCSHRAMNLIHSQICKDNTLLCPYHGKKNKSVALIEKYDFLWLHSPDKYFSHVPPNYIFCGSESIELKAPFHVVVDNFNEGSHTPHIHKFLGPDIKDLDKIKFNWSESSDSIYTEYSAPQKKNLLFYGLNWFRTIEWKINWSTYTQPVYMRYYSEWFDQTSNKKIIEENMTYFFLVPADKETTRIIAFVFIRPLTWLKYFPFLVKKISLFMTMNQIKEDNIFYEKISDLPVSFDNLQLDQYDQPLIEIRKRLKSFFKD